MLAPMTTYKQPKSGKFLWFLWHLLVRSLFLEYTTRFFTKDTAMLRFPALFATVLLARVLISAAARTHEPASGDEIHMGRRCIATIRSAA